MKKLTVIILITVSALFCLELFADNSSNEKGQNSSGYSKEYQRTRGKADLEKQDRDKARLMRERLTQERLKDKSPEELRKLDKKILKMQKEHDEFIAELIVIKQTAQTENAPKTVDMLEDLIARKNKEFNGRVEPLNTKRKEIAENIREAKLHRHMNIEKMKELQEQKEQQDKQEK